MMPEQIILSSWSTGTLATSVLLGLVVYWIATAVESRLARIRGRDVHGSLVPGWSDPYQPPVPRGAAPAPDFHPLPRLSADDHSRTP